MRYLTDRKRAVGHGSSRTGTLDHIFMTNTAYGLVILVPLMIWVIGQAIFLPYEEARAYLGRPFPAIVLGLNLVVGLRHYMGGVTMMIEDYVHGFTREILVLFARGLAWVLMAAGLYALIVLAFGH